MNFVHDDAEFSDLVQIVAAARRIAPALVEKDYWVTHTLWALLDQGFDIWFKGGTSLAKGFGLIQRFSEDLDLKIEPGAVVGLPAVSNWKSTAKAASSERQRHFVALAKAIRVPATTIDLVPTDDPSCRSAELRVHYPGQLLRDLGPTFRAFVLLEVGNARVVPSVAVDASSFVHDHLAQAGQAADFVDNRPRGLRCVHPLVTLLEKLDAIRRRFDKGAAAATFVRHFEDAAHVIAKVASLPSLTDYRHARELADEMLDQRQLAGVVSASDAAFHPDRSARWTAVRRAHEAIDPMFWGPRIPLASACATIRSWITSALAAP